MKNTLVAYICRSQIKKHYFLFLMGQMLLKIKKIRPLTLELTTACFQIVLNSGDNRKC